MHFLRVYLLVIERLQPLSIRTHLCQLSHRRRRVDSGIVRSKDTVRGVGESGTLLVLEDGDEDATGAVDELRMGGGSAAVRVLNFEGGRESRVGTEVEEVVQRAKEAREVESANEGESVTSRREEKGENKLGSRRLFLRLLRRFLLTFLFRDSQ
jgi:hypothetical protein